MLRWKWLISEYNLRELSFLPGGGADFLGVGYPNTINGKYKVV